MSFLDDIFGPVTQDMVGLFGKTVAYAHTGPGTYDPETSISTPGAPVNLTLPAIIEEYRGLELTSGLVQAGDKKVSIAGAEFVTAPQPTAAITVDGQAYTVVEVAAIYSGSNVALYTLKCRRT